jgi:hypothetical protein
MPTDEPVMQRAVRPTQAAPRPRYREKRYRPRIGCEELGRRFARGLDLWTGQPLRGLDALNWRRLQFDMCEICEEEPCP